MSEYTDRQRLEWLEQWLDTARLDPLRHGWSPAYCEGFNAALTEARYAVSGALSYPNTPKVACDAGDVCYEHRCTLYKGHDGWHQSWRDGQLWAEWRESDTPT